MTSDEPAASHAPRATLRPAHEQGVRSGPWSGDVRSPGRLHAPASRGAWLLLLLLAGCPELSEGPIKCITSLDCPAGWGCGITGVCDPDAPASVLRVVPAEAEVRAGDEASFQATLDGAAHAVSWSTEGAGTISADGVFVAPDHVPAPDTVTIWAASQQDPAVRASATIRILERLNPVPRILTVTPFPLPAGPEAATLVIRGAGFDRSTSLRLGAQDLPTTFVSDTELRSTLPATLVAAPGTIVLTAFTSPPGGGLSEPFELAVVNPVPVLSALEPASAMVGEPTLVLTVQGTGFMPSSRVRWGEPASASAASYLATTYVDFGTLRATVPGSLLATQGSVSLAVETPVPGGGASSSVPFVIGPSVPQISALQPAWVVVGAAAFSLTVRGTRFSSGCVIDFGGLELATTFVSASELRAPVPAGQLGVPRVIPVRVKDGTAISPPKDFGVGNPVPTFTSVSPSRVLAGASATSLTLNGSEFMSGAQASLDGAALATVFVSATRLTATVPGELLAHGRAGQLTVRNPAPTASASAALAFTVDPVIRTVVGRPVEGLPTLKVPMLSVQNAAFHPTSGELYYADSLRHQIFRVDAGGTVRLVAGTREGFAGDGGPALAAQLSSPGALAFTADGSLLVADRANQRIRKISTTGTISTFAGGGWCNNTADGWGPVDAQVGDITDLKVTPSGAIYLAVCGCNGNRVRKISGSPAVIRTVAGDPNGVAGSSGDGGPATSATLNCPRAIALDSQERLYIAEASAHRIRFVDGSGVISTYAGNGEANHLGDGGPALQAGIKDPRGLALMPNGDLYVSEFDAQVIRRISASSRVIERIAGDYRLGPLSPDGAAAFDASIGHPWGLFALATGEVGFAVDKFVWSDYAGIKKIAADGRLVSLAGGLPDVGPLGTDTLLAFPEGVAAANGNLYVVDTGHDRILKIDSGGRATRFAGTGNRNLSDQGSGLAADLWNPHGVWVDPAGNLFLTQFGRVSRIDRAGNIGRVVGDTMAAGCPQGAPTSPPAGSTGYNCIGDGWLASTAYTLVPWGIVGDGAGSLYFTEARWLDGTGSRVRKVDLVTGMITTIAGSTAATGESCGYSGDGGPASAARLCDPRGVALTPAGDLLIVDSGNRRLRQVNLKTAPVGVISTVGLNGQNNSSGDGGPVGAASMCRPLSAVYDSDGNLYVSDSDCHTVRKVDTQGVIRTFAGLAASAGFAGDLGAPGQALLGRPQQLSVAGSPPVLYISDSQNHRIRQIGP